MISLEKVDFAYENREILNNFSLNVGNDERVCLFGNSGCGKTTILKLIMGLIKPAKGKIMTPKKISVVFQEDRLLPWFNVVKNVSKVTGVSEKQATEILKSLGLENSLDMMPKDLSGGMKRRVAIARAIAFGGEALLLDEPFNGVDSETKAQIVDAINKQFPKQPIIIVTHIKEDAEILNAKIINL